MKPVVTVSASYGAGGSVVAPRVAAMLGSGFLDRVVSAESTAEAAEAAAGEGATPEERTDGLIARLMTSFARLPESFGPAITPPDVVHGDELVRARAEQVVRDFAASTGGVVLGWGGVMILGGAFHVRLDGRVDGRVRQAMVIEGVDEATARRRLEHTDRVRSRYLRRFYGRDAGDPSLYHLVLDSTALSLDACAELTVAAARAFWARCATA